jgi:hypothetical protein
MLELCADWNIYWGIRVVFVMNSVFYGNFTGVFSFSPQMQIKTEQVF